MSRSCVIFDLDGTICNIKHRLHHALTRPKDMQAFHDACTEDEPHGYVVRLYKMLLGQLPIMICSSRPDSHRVQTIAWLHQHGLYFVELFMRDPEDKSPDAVVKKQMLQTIKDLGYEPLFAVEDRPTVVKMWRDNGVPCLVVDQESWIGQEGDDGLGLATVWHEGSKSFYHAKLLEKMSVESVMAESAAAAGEEPDLQ